MFTMNENNVMLGTVTTDLYNCHYDSSIDGMMSVFHIFYVIESIFIRMFHTKCVTMDITNNLKLSRIVSLQLNLSYAEHIAYVQHVLV